MPKAARGTESNQKAVKTPKKYSKPTGKTAKLYSSFLPIPLVLPTPTSIPTTSSKPLTNVTHYIYVRPHVNKIKVQDVRDDLNGVVVHPDGRTAFVANLPIDMTERDMRVLFAKWGVIESMDFTGRSESGSLLERAVMGMEDSDDDEDNEDEGVDEENPADPEDDVDAERQEPTFQGNGPRLPRRLRPRRKPALPASVPDVTPLPPLDPRTDPYGKSGARCAHVVFLDDLSVTRLMAHRAPIEFPSYGRPPSSSKSGEDPNPRGLDYYLARHDALRPTLSAVKEFADTSMARFDHLHSLLLQSRAKKQGAGALVDEDGFTVVVRGGRYGRTGGRGPGTLGVGVAKTLKGDLKMKKKGGGADELQDFYKFQKADRKRQGKRALLIRLKSLVHIPQSWRVCEPSSSRTRPKSRS